MPDRLALTMLIDDQPVEIYERIAAAPTPMVVETFYVLPAPDWPKVRMRARRNLGRLLNRLGRRTGLMLDDERFNAAFRVDSEDPDFAVLLLSPKLQAYLLEKTDVDWSAGRGAIKLFYRGQLRRDRVDRSLERLRRFRDLIDAELFTLTW